MSDRPTYCCGACPAVEPNPAHPDCDACITGYDCTCRDNPRCPNYQEPPMTDITDQDRRAEKIEEAKNQATEAHQAQKAETNRLAAEVENLRGVLAEYKDALTRSNDRHRAEVERLTAERDRITSGRYITYAEVDGKTVQKGAESNAESNAESIDPADVKEEEPYHIYYGVYGNDHTIGVRIDGKWRCIGDDNGVRVTDDNIARLTRLVPAPRVITNHYELDTLAEGVVIATATGIARVRQGWYWLPMEGAGPRVISAGVSLPVTVLWEPGA